MSEGPRASSSGDEWGPRAPWFLLATLVALAVFAVGSDSHMSALHPRWLERLGLAWRDLLEGRWERLVTSALTTHGGPVFWRAMLVTALVVGACEQLVGSVRTALTFWGVHLMSCLVLLAAAATVARWHPAIDAEAFGWTRDVGPSAGWFGCLGLLLATAPRRIAWVAWGGLALGLGAEALRALSASGLSSADAMAALVHPIALVLGRVSASSPWERPR